MAGIVDQRVVNYIKEQLSNGFTREQIKQGLLSQGWEESKIDDAMQSIPSDDSSLHNVKNHEQVPGLVKFFAVIGYIGSVLEVLLGISLIIGGSLLNSFLLSSLPFLGFLGSNLFIILGIVSLGIAVFNFFIARGLWKGQKWARVIFIVFTILGILSSIYITTLNTSAGILSILLTIAISGYFLFNKKVKQAFA